jgi:ML domain
MGILSLLGAASAILSNCGHVGDLAMINTYGITPQNPVPNENITIWVDYTLLQDVKNGTAYYTASLNGLPYSESANLCTELECPILAGDYNQSFTAVFYDFSGKLVTTIQWETDNKSPIWCVQATFKN